MKATKIILGLLALGLIGASIYYMYFDVQPADTTAVDENDEVVDVKKPVPTEVGEPTIIGIGGRQTGVNEGREFGTLPSRQRLNASVRRR